MNRKSPAAWQNERLQGSGVTLAADIGGAADRPTVFLMHGGGQTRHSWASTMQMLVAAGYRVVNFDARGHGESDWSTDGQYSFVRHADDLVCILDSQAPGAFALVGASMGGITALEAVGRGVRPAAVVLVDIVLRPERRGVERIRNFMAGHPDGFASLADAVAAVAAYNPHRAKPGDPRGLMRNLRLRADGRLHWHWDPRMVASDLDEDLRSMGSIVERLTATREVPTLLIRGRSSDVLSDRSVADLKRYLPHAEVLDVAGAGHMVAGDNNEIFAHGLTEYLARHLQPGAPGALECPSA